MATEPSGGGRPRRRLPSWWIVILVGVVVAVVSFGLVERGGPAPWFMPEQFTRTGPWLLVPALVAMAFAALVWFTLRHSGLPEFPPPSSEQLAEIPAKERVELITQRQQTRMQAVNSIGVVVGVIFTAGSLIATALTLHSTQEAQISDRYTKAIEQLGSSKSDVRLGGIFALEKLAADSGRDHESIVEVLAAFVRGHIRQETRQPARSRKPMVATDVLGALTVLGRLVGQYAVLQDPPEPDDGVEIIDLNNLDGAGLDLTGASLDGVYLASADLRGARLKSAFTANLARADLRKLDGESADLESASFEEADLRGANLTDATLDDADLTSARLRGVNLEGASLCGVSLANADLRGARLYGAVLTDADDSDCPRVDVGKWLVDADLRGTDLREVEGLDPAVVRKVARTDGKTRF
ncbi:pentapeptide repeat-containing protein [Actinomadura barringtoniae]|uniref:Pentapeptide repeat-containing protein n=1 Tax=Actinomadura barringtoniae TaxID=1427535 RepID=A0A939T7R7_9ACTN|nr:pentapeptide repeat-containing protein [Actinomadura barringtoniae]MBO2452304.1 pentapeptide repeat-containing protein [Actinomadura barringtoniae]